MPGIVHFDGKLAAASEVVGPPLLLRPKPCHGGLLGLAAHGWMEGGLWFVR